MPIFNAGNISSGQLTVNLQKLLKQHVLALEALNDLYTASSGWAQADLEAVGFAPADAGAYLSAVSDAHAEYLIHTTGLPPSSYPQPPSDYIYAASQAAVLGPALGSP